ELGDNFSLPRQRASEWHLPAALAIRRRRQLPTLRAPRRARPIALARFLDDLSARRASRSPSWESAALIWVTYAIPTRPRASSTRPSTQGSTSSTTPGNI